MSVRIVCELLNHRWNIAPHFVVLLIKVKMKIKLKLLKYSLSSNKAIIMDCVILAVLIISAIYDLRNLLDKYYNTINTHITVQTYLVMISESPTHVSEPNMICWSPILTVYYLSRKAYQPQPHVRDVCFSVTILPIMGSSKAKRLASHFTHSD
jgi:hypothetical protein